MGIVLVYDVSDEKSFANIQNWAKNVEEYACEGVMKILVGNKCDIEERRVISTEQGKELAAQLGMQFMETSAKTAQNVEHLFTSLAAQVKSKIEETANAKASSVLNLSKAVNAAAAQSNNNKSAIGSSAVEKTSLKCCSIV